ncbi:MAG: PIN domain-containing protein [Candidatus Atribacteria bacterium]|nr:PIN domain-containing protein [Candidatus Atribacteria bacterium]
MDKVLIDTDVVLDFFFDKKPFSEHAAIIFSLCELKSIQGFITPVICSNVYYLLRQTAKHEKVIEKLNQLLSITDVLDMNKEIVRTALNSKFKDFEDALQNYAAVKSGIIDTILTRNIKDYKNSEIAVFTPEDYLKLKIARC